MLHAVNSKGVNKIHALNKASQPLHNFMLLSYFKAVYTLPDIPILLYHNYLN